MSCRRIEGSGFLMLKDTQQFEVIDGAEIQAAPDFCYSRPVKPVSPKHHGVIGCLSGDARIKTLYGEKRLRDLQQGDPVLTRDNGFQPVKWVGRCTHADQNGCRMLVLRADALAPGVPSRDLHMSVHQRVLSGGGPLRDLSRGREALIRARDLAQMTWEAERVEGWQILMQRHELILANDVWTESFQPDAAFYRSSEAHIQRQLRRICPELAKGQGHAFPAARVHAGPGPHVSP